MERELCWGCNGTGEIIKYEGDPENPREVFARCSVCRGGGLDESIHSIRVLAQKNEPAHKCTDRFGVCEDCCDHDLDESDRVCLSCGKEMCA